MLKQSELEAQWERDRVVPQQRADFICKQLNIMVQADDQAFVQPEVIKRNNQVIPMDALIGRRCYGGFDLLSGYLWIVHSHFERAGIG